MKIYTKTGDDGTTGLLGGPRVRKDASRIEAHGAVDELNAAIGLAAAHLSSATESARGWLSAVQSDLFSLGTLLATPPAAPARAELPASRTEALERHIDQMEAALQPLKNFILPQGAPCAGFIHMARAVCRRAERRMVQLAGQETVDPALLAYMNRLSDFLFVLARWVNHREGGTETLWKAPPPGAGAKETLPAGQPDRLQATLQKLESDKENRKTLFEKASSDLEKRKQSAEQAFREGVDQIKKEGGKVEKPLRDLDLD